MSHTQTESEWISRGARYPISSSDRFPRFGGPRGTTSCPPTECSVNSTWIFRVGGGGTKAKVDNLNTLICHGTKMIIRVFVIIVLFFFSSTKYDFHLSFYPFVLNWILSHNKLFCHPMTKNQWKRLPFHKTRKKKEEEKLPTRVVLTPNIYWPRPSVDFLLLLLWLNYNLLWAN